MLTSPLTVTAKLFLFRYDIVTVITFYSPSCLSQETAKGPFGLRVKLPPVLLSTTHDGGFTMFLQWLSVMQESCEYQFYSLWFDPTENRTRFNSSCAIHSTTDQCNFFF